MEAVDSFCRVFVSRYLQRRVHDDAAVAALRDLSGGWQGKLRGLHARQQSSSGGADDLAGHAAAAGLAGAAGFSSGVHPGVRSGSGLWAEPCGVCIDNGVATQDSRGDGRHGLRRAESAHAYPDELDQDERTSAACCASDCDSAAGFVAFPFLAMRLSGLGTALLAGLDFEMHGWATRL